MGVTSCVRSSGAPEPRPPTAALDARIVRVALGTSSRPVIGASGSWRLVDGSGTELARGDSAQRLTVANSGGRLRIARAGATDRVIPGSSTSITIEPSGAGALATFAGRRYRGTLTLSVADTLVRAVNVLDLEAYLRGVVPREIGPRNASERAAVEAQAVAARSYAFARLGNTARGYDLAATTADQVYGGVDAENALADAAIAATAGLVIFYGDRIVSGQYYSTCGGTSAEPAELWRSRNEPYLQRVSDRIPNSNRYYCDIAPRFRWERTWRADTLAAVIERYLRAYAQAPAEPLGAVRAVAAEQVTASGRVADLRVEMERGTYHVRGNDIRNVLRSAGGEPLNSTYFSPDAVTGADGRLSRLTVRGFGYGHGVGMCQWGAIGRARAGQDFRTILRTYYPGTRVARAY